MEGNGMFRGRKIRLLLLSISLIVIGHTDFAGASKEESVSFQTNVPYDKAYEIALNVVKKEGLTIESASKETGQIKTEMVIEHSVVDIGRWFVITLIRESDDVTTIRVSAFKQGRRIGGQWQQRVYTKEKAQKLADKIKAALEPASQKEKPPTDL
jgi:hypothetical protein